MSTKREIEADKLFQEGYKLFKKEQESTSLQANLDFVSYLRKAERKGSVKARFLLGYILCVPFKDISVDLEKGNKILKKCFKPLSEMVEISKDPQACLFLSKYYEIPLANHVKDLEKVKKLLVLANLDATLDNQKKIEADTISVDSSIESLVNAINMLQTPNRDDVAEIINLIKVNADNGNIRAMIFLGDCYLEGKYVKKDDSIAKLYYSLAEEKGSYRGKFNLGKMLVEGRYSDANIALGLNKIYQAAKAGLKEALYYLGVIYYEGKYLEKDLDKAYLYFQASFSRNYLPSKEYLIKIEQEKGDALVLSFIKDKQEANN